MRPDTSGPHLSNEEIDSLINSVEKKGAGMKTKYSYKINETSSGRFCLRIYQHRNHFVSECYRGYKKSEDDCLRYWHRYMKKKEGGQG